MLLNKIAQRTRNPEFAGSNFAAVSAPAPLCCTQKKKKETEKPKTAKSL